MATQPIPADSPPAELDVLTLLSQLSADGICARLDALEAERRALQTLLRAARARERSLTRARKAAHA
jgi:hypothetical protein